MRLKRCVNRYKMWNKKAGKLNKDFSATLCAIVNNFLN